MIDTTTREWFAIRTYIEGRIQELSDQCTSVGCPENERLPIAHRIDELRNLLREPEAARARAQVLSKPQLNGVY